MILPSPVFDIATRKLLEVSEQNFEFIGPLVVVGANGSGKSKLGSWIEDKILPDQVNRISSQRALSIPENIPLKNVEQSLNEVIYGHPTNKKKGNRWSQGKTTTLLNDITSLLSLLFAHEAKRDADFTKSFKLASATAKATLTIQESPIEKLIRIWNELLPHRQIILEDNKIKINLSPNDSYVGNEMSDGEKVTIYLLSHCLTAPENHTIIIDEPESHLHRAIVSKLWDQIEGLRSDCKFIYITHDFEFATSRQTGAKIWCKEYVNPNKWDWEFIEEKDDLPESLKLELLGSRKNILFTEGVLGGIDHAIFSEVYQGFKVVPVASCSKVIESSKAFRSYGQLTHLQIAGIIDRDFRTPAEIQALSTGHRIFSLPVAEIENVLISEQVFRVVAQSLGYDSNQKVIELLAAVKTQLNGQESPVAFRSACRFLIRMKSRNVRHSK